MATTAGSELARTFAQRFCLVAGTTLVVVGVLGFAADAGFETGSAIQGDELVLFEVNGWHNIVHLASGLVLLSAANTRPTARWIAWAFGAVYAFVTLWGLVDGDEVLNLFPVNGADNVLHLLLAGAAIACAWVSPTTSGQQRRRLRDRLARDREADDERARRDYVAESERGGKPPRS